MSVPYSYPYRYPKIRLIGIGNGNGIEIGSLAIREQLRDNPRTVR
jgi:hypothetical protein